MRDASHQANAVTCECAESGTSKLHNQSGNQRIGCSSAQEGVGGVEQPFANGTTLTHKARKEDEWHERVKRREPGGAFEGTPPKEVGPFQGSNDASAKRRLPMGQTTAPSAGMVHDWTRPRTPKLPSYGQRTEMSEHPNCLKSVKLFPLAKFPNHLKLRRQHERHSPLTKSSACILFITIL